MFNICRKSHNKGTNRCVLVVIWTCYPYSVFQTTSAEKKPGYFFLQFPSFPEDFDWGLNIPTDMLLLCRLILILPLLSCRLQVSNTNLEIVPFVNI